MASKLNSALDTLSSNLELRSSLSDSRPSTFCRIFVFGIQKKRAYFIEQNVKIVGEANR